MFSHNKNCDNKFWFGELSLKGFEEFIFNDNIMKPPLNDAYYDEVIEHSWPGFIIDSAFM